MNPPSQLPDLRPDYHLISPMEDEAAPHNSMFRPQRIIPFLLRFWWLPVVTLFVGLGAAAAFVWWKPPTFVSQGRMWETVKMRLPEGSMFTEDVQNFLGTQTELLQSEALNQLALARLRSSSNNVAVPLDRDGQPLPVVVNVRGVSKSSVFLIQATSSRAAYAQAYLDALMNVYLEYKRNIRKVVSGDTLASISEQVQRAERDLKAEQDILTLFQRTNNLAILEEEGRTSGGYLARLRTQLSDLHLESRLLSITASNAAAPGSDTNASLALAAAGSGPDSAPSVGAPLEQQAAFREIELLKMQREKLSRYLRPKHPKIAKLDADLERGTRLIEIYQRQGHDQLETARAALQMKMDNVQLSIKEWESKVVLANSRMAEGERLKQNVARMQSIYERLSLLVQNVGISRNIDQETLAILEPASAAMRSYKQEIGLVGAAGFGGVGLGLAIILLLAVRDDRFTSFAEINEQLGQSVVGQVPAVVDRKTTGALPLLEVDDERHAYAESFRSLRSALIFMTIASERPRVVLVTSALPNEGKSTVAANLARALAMGGSRVVLVDGDLRQGVLHERLALPQSPGLAEVLRDPAQLAQATQTNCLPNLAFIGSGHVVGNCGDVFLGPAFDQLLAQLREQYEFVIIDSSPVFAADDASTLAPKVDGTLFVVRSGFSRTGPVREALGLLYQRNARVLGVIFNQADTSARSNYYYKYAEYYQGRGGKQQLGKQKAES